MIGSLSISAMMLAVHPSLKDTLRAAVQREHRSIANMVEVLLRDYCEKHGITIVSPEDFESNSGGHSA